MSAGGQPGTDEFAHARRRPQQVRSAETFEAILKAADFVFGEVGVDRTKTTDIAARAEVSVGSLYHLFPDKWAIAQALADRYLDEAATIYLNAAAHLTSLAGVGPFVSDVVHGLADLNAAHPGFFAVARHRDPTQSDAPSAHVREAQIESMVLLFTPFAPDVEESDANRVAANCVDVARALLERVPAEPAEREPYLDEFVELVLAYLARWLPGLDDALA